MKTKNWSVLTESVESDVIRRLQDDGVVVVVSKSDNKIIDVSLCSKFEIIIIATTHEIRLLQ